MNELSISAVRRLKRNRGSALIVTLVLLLVITVIGIAGMAGTLLQERMAGNLQGDLQVFEATESALRRCAERIIDGDSDTDGRATPEEMAGFRAGEVITPDKAEYFQVSETLTTQGDTDLQLTCLIESGGTLDAARTGGSLRRGTESGGELVGYVVTASGSRVASGESVRERPTVILQSDVIRRR